MDDYAVYWPYYPQESGRDGKPVVRWRFNRESLVHRLRPGDRFWLFVGGDVVDHPEAPGQAYLAQLLVVKSWRNDREYQPGVSGSPRFEVLGDENRCILVEPPLLVDQLFRQSARDTRHIGMLRQTPFELDWQLTEELLKLLKAERLAVHAVATMRTG
jgi:hypothetical protein